MTENEQQVPERDHKQRSLVVSCPSCGAVVEARLGSASEPARLPDALSCASCSTTIDLPHGEQLAGNGTLDGCPSCGYHTLCIQKDVNPRLGVILVAVSFAILLFSGLSIPQMLVGLVVLAAIDLALMRFVVRRLLICYRCKAQYRGFLPGPNCRPFDLSTWEAHDAPAGD